MKKIAFFLLGFLLYVLQGWSQPVNDTPSQAIDITSLIGTCSSDAAYTTVGATPDGSEATCWDTSPDHNVWFKFQAPSTGQIRIVVERGDGRGDIQYINAAIYDSDAQTEISCNKYFYSDDDVTVQAPSLTPGNWYYLAVDNVDGNEGTFSLCVYDTVDYDYYEGAVDVTGLINACSANSEFTTLGATPDRNAASCWNALPSYNRWFKFQAPASGMIRAVIKRGGAYGSIMEINAAIWEADGTTEVACNRYVYSEDEVTVQAKDLTPGDWYYISVDNAQDIDSGTFTLCLYDTLDYDFYEGAIDVTSLINSCSGQSEYTTAGATPDRNAASCWNAAPNYNRWFKVQAPSSGILRVVVDRGGTAGTIENINVAIWEADGTTEVACNRYVYTQDDVTVQAKDLTPGDWYYISVDNAGSYARGSFTLCVYDSMDYDFYEGAEDITGYMNSCSPQAVYTTVGATPDRNAASCWNTSPDFNRWFKFQAPSSGVVSVEVKTGGADGSVRYLNAALWGSDGTTEIACNRYVDSDDNILLQAVGLNPGDWYYLSVDNSSGLSRGTFTVCLKDEVDYDFYEGAYDITDIMNSCSEQAIYTTEGATPDRNAASCWDTSPNYNRWFKFTATSTDITIVVRTGGSDGTIQNINLALWDTDGVTELACARYTNPDDDVTLGYQGLNVGQVYYISVDNSGADNKGTFTICLHDPSIVWTGNASNNWHKESNWDPPVVPTDMDYVLIPTNPEGGRFPETMEGEVADAMVLTIRPGAYVVIPEGHLLRVGKQLYILADSEKTGALVDYGDENQLELGDKAYIQRYLFAGDYHYVSTPIEGVTIEDAFPGSAAHYWYDETQGTDDRMQGWQWATGTMTNALGYAIYYSTDKLIQFVGNKVNSGDYYIGVTFSDGSLPADDRGFNLVGNPYPSAIDADAFINANTDVIEGTVYFWNDANGDGVYQSEDYAMWNGAGTAGVGGGQVPNGKIGAHQGFMVKATTNGNVVFKNSMRDTNNSQFFRPAETINRLRFQLHDDRKISDALIAFKSDGTDGFDRLYDGRKAAAYGYLSLYTKVGETPLGIQTFGKDALQRDNFTVPLNFYVREAGNYVIDLSLFEALDQVHILLRDNYLNVTVPVTAGFQYRFYSDAGQYEDRFDVIFNARTLDAKEETVAEWSVFPNPAKDFTEIRWKNAGRMHISVTDMQGKVILDKTVENQNSLRLQTRDWETGLYLVKLEGDQAGKTFKLIKE